MAARTLRKGVILAGGTATRLHPLTKVTNKHLLPVGRYPMIYWPLGTLIQCGVDNIMVTTGVEHLDSIVRVLGSGANFEVRFTYRVQDKAGGIAQALGLCEDFVGQDNVMVILGDNIYAGDLSAYQNGFTAGARILLQPRKDPERFGVGIVEGNRVVKIIEKPADPPSNLVVTGCYLYDCRVFDIIRRLKPSGRGELEITDVNNAYIERGELTYSVINVPWTDAGTFESLHEANKMVQGMKLSFDGTQRI
jgi:glucose-1-phosphate thymidylyltransferase